MNRPTSQTKTLRSGEKNGVIQDHPGVQGKPKPRTQSPGPHSWLLLPLCMSSTDPGEATVFIFWDCGFKQEEFICLVLEARSPTARCWQGHSSSEGSVFIFWLLDGLFQLLLLLAFFGLRLPSDLCLSSHGLLLCLCVSSSSLCLISP